MIGHSTSKAILGALALAAVAGCAGPESEPAPSARLVVMNGLPAGERIARRECGECHSIDGREPSPLADAPAFPTLRSRYSREDMAWVLDQRALEAHRRMPLLRIDVDELTWLLDYWDAIEPSPPTSGQAPSRNPFK